MKLYYEFLHFYNCTKINYIEFSKIGSYIKLQKIVGKSPEETWKEEELGSFRANYYYFKQLYESMGGKAIDLKLTPNVGYKKSLLEKLFNDEQKVAKVAFVHDKTPEDIIEQAAKDDNEIIFTTSPKLLKASLAVAVKYPDKTILNCSLNKSHRSSSKALNYYWGISAGVIEMICSQKLPNGVQRLVEFLKKSISSGVYNPFIGPIYTQEETVIDADAEGLGYEDIIGMNWLLNNVVGINILQR